MVRMTTLGAAAQGRAAVISRVASRPSMPGIRMSMSTTSGASARAAATASVPLAASPTTLIPSAASRITQKPARTSSWSSTTSTRTGPAGAAPPSGWLSAVAGLMAHAYHNTRAPGRSARRRRAG